MILEKETLEKFGYSLSLVSPCSTKLVVASCNDCGLLMDRKRVNIKNTNIILCLKCQRARQLTRYSLLTDEQKVEIQNKIKASNLLKYGCEHSYQSEIVKAKIKATNIARYGTSCARQSKEVNDKIKATNLERYGAEHPSKNAEVIARMKASNLEKYGVENISLVKEVQDKRKDTFLNKYGVTSPGLIPEVQEKMKATNLEKYGVENSLSSPEIKSKIAATVKERYGENGTFGNKEIIRKSRATIMERYGVEHAMQSPEIVQKAKATSLLRYGVDNPSKSIEVITKILQTKLDRYGTLTAKYGKKQNEIEEWLNLLGYNFKSDISILKGKEIDLYCDELKLGIEYCGLYWHNESKIKDKNYHYNKYLKCKEQGIRLITIFEDEWLLKEQQCKNYIKLLLHKCDIVDFKDCHIKDIIMEEAILFINKNSVLPLNQTIDRAVGLFHDTMLLYVLVKNNRTVSIHSSDVLVPTGASNLIAYLNSSDKLIANTDNRWMDSDIYRQLGFTHIKDVKPGYTYIEIRGLEKVAKGSKYLKIWDCGSTVWQLS